LNGRQPDVIVVGGGLVGCSIAYRLSAAGKRVLLLEQRGICSGASGRNGGITGEGSAMHKDAGAAVYALTSANLRMMAELADELETDFELRLSGTLDIATTPEQWAHLQQGADIQRASGLEVELLDAHDAQKMMPALRDDIVGAELSRRNGHLWPFSLVHGFANDATRLGTTIRTGTAVTRLHQVGERVQGVELADGLTVESEEVVLATNAYTPLILPELPAGAIVPARGQILVTQPVAPILPRPFGTNFGKEYGRQVAGGPILCGGYRRLDENEGLGHYEERVTLPVLSGIAKCLTGLFPALRDVNVVRCWSGIMGFTADGLPLIGRMRDMPGLTLAAGFNGGGFSWGAILGKVIAAELAGKHHGFDLAPFRPDRFAECGTAWTNPFTAGERDAGAPALRPVA
jgi:sarcosine oxidase subunit beta